MAMKSVFLYILLSIAVATCGKLTESRKTTTEVRKILIIGATGQAGSKILSEALNRGLQVKAFSRNPSKLSQDIRDKVEAVEGDIQNYDDVQNAVRGVDAVIVVISPRSLEDTSKYMTRGLQNVINAMKAENVEIINALLSVYAIMPTEEIPEMFRIEIEDQHAMYDALKNSGLKFIASCPPDFKQYSAEAYEAQIGGMPGGKNFTGGVNVISLNQLAKYFIDSLSKPAYYGQIVGLRNKLQHKNGVKHGIKH